jgi:hypothetical protein
MDAAYEHDKEILIEALDEVNNHKKALLAAKNDIERLAAIEQIVIYSSLLDKVSSWTLAKIRYPEGAKAAGVR